MEKPNRIFNFRLIVFVALSLICGITTAYFFMLNNAFWGVVVLSLFFLALSLYFIPYKRGNPVKVKIVFALVFLSFFLIGNLSFNFKVNDYAFADLGAHQYAVTGRVEEVIETDSGVRLLVKNVSIKGNRTGYLRYGIYAYVYGKTDVEVGHHITFNSVLKDKGIIYEGEFASADVLRGVKYMTELSPDDLTVTQKTLTVFEKVNLFIKNTLELGLDENEFSTSYAMLTGHDEFMDYDLLSSYRSAGVAHIFAVSGLHIGFLAMALGFVFDKLKINRLVKAIIITLALLFYSGVCGFSASSLRATIMTAVSLFLTVRGARYDGLTSISLSAIIILLMQPVNLFYVGFQLSFIVVLGILILSPTFIRLFKFLPKKLASSLASVLAAQIVGIPVCLAAFKQFSLIAIFTNLIFIPIVSIIFIALLICTLVGGIFGIYRIALFLPNYILKFVNMCISAFDLDVFMVGGVVMGGFILLYALIFLVMSDVVQFKRKLKAILCFIFAVIFTVGTSAITVKTNSASYLYVLGSEKICATVIKTPEESVMVVSSVNRIYSAGRLRRLSSRENIPRINTVIILGGFNVDEQVFLTKLRSAFKVDNLCYYGQTDKSMEEIINKSFKDVKVYALTDGKAANTKKIECRYALDGRALSVKVNGKKIAIFAPLKNGGSYSGLDGNYHVSVSVDTPESVKAYYNCAVGVGYLSKSAAIDGESKGTFKYQIS